MIRPQRGGGTSSLPLLRSHSTACAVKRWRRFLVALVVADCIVFVWSYDVAGLHPVLFTTIGGLFGAAMAFRIADEAR
jgi:hypothetical protein